ncbi:MAG: peptidylprolyl isomerase [Bacteroidetes bacterium]|nr:MAG: peptidylprolyl isomerase [Bacteroidota bacterium]
MNLKSSIGLLLLLLLGTTACRHQPAVVRIQTDMGLIRVRLFDDTPLHRDNFLKLAETGFYDSLLFHRVIRGFMIQGGDPDSKHAPAGVLLGAGGPGYTLPAEIKRPFVHGALAAARLSDKTNPERASNGSQFFIVDGRPQTDQSLDGWEKRFRMKLDAKRRALYKEKGGVPQLEGQYTVFGEVIEGLDVLDQIAAVPRDANDRPLHDIRMWVTVE